MLTELATRHGPLTLPVFCPDATRGVVRSVGADDLRQCGVQGLVVNTLHLARAPGVGLVKSQGGIHAFMGWDRPVISDSGGFQAMSVIRQNPRYGSLSDAGISYVNADAPDRKKLKLTPEKCIQMQFDLGADLMVCLDDCPRADADRDQVEESVRRTILWARRCKEEFERQVATRRWGAAKRPLLFGVIHGGPYEGLRQRCAQELQAMGFDGYGLGGWPLDAAGELAEETLAFTASLMPDHLPKYALGVGSPQNIVRCYKMGYDIFDCVLPTRDARHQRLYCFDGEDSQGSTEITNAAGTIPYSFLYIQDDLYKRDARPISQVCDCECCRRYSRSYLHHLFQIQDGLALRLATVHNLRFYTMLMYRTRDLLGKTGAVGGDTAV